MKIICFVLLFFCTPVVAQWGPSIDVSSAACGAATTLPDNSAAFNACAATGQPFVTVQVPGVYKFSTYFSPAAGQTFVLSPGVKLQLNAGATTSVVWLGNANSSIESSGTKYQGAAIIDGNSANAPSGSCINGGSVSGLRIEGLTIQNCAGSGIGEIANAPFLTIKNNRITNTGYIAIYVLNTLVNNLEGVLIEDNYIDRSMIPAASIVEGGIKIHQNSSGGSLRAIVRGNTVKMPASPADGTCIPIELWLGWEATVADNQSVGGAGGISVASLSESIVTGNLIEGASYLGVEFANSSRVIGRGNVIRGMGLTPVGVIQTGNAVSTDNDFGGNLFYPGM